MRPTASAAPTAGCGRRWPASPCCWPPRSWPAPSRSPSAATARHAAVVADAQRLGAQALTDDRVDRGLLLARAGTALDDSVATRSSLLSELLRHPAAVGVLPGTGNRPNCNAISPDGRTLAIEDNAATVLLVNPMTHRLAAPPLRADGGLDFSSDGRTLASRRRARRGSSRSTSWTWRAGASAAISTSVRRPPSPTRRSARCSARASASW